MNFETLNLKDTFKVWRIALVLVLIAFTVWGLAYVVIEWPKPSYDPIFGYYASGLNRNNPEHEFIVGLAAAIPVVDVALLVCIKLFAKWEKDAKGYGLSIEGTKVNILCEGKLTSLETKDIDRFEVLPKNSEPTLFKSKWTDVGYIVSGGQTYKLYYLKNIQQAKNIFESNKSYQQN